MVTTRQSTNELDAELAGFRPPSPQFWGNRTGKSKFGVQTAASRPPDQLIDFTLMSDLEATAPPEARGLARDEVRLMVTREALGPENSGVRIEHALFRDLPDFLSPGDLVVVNTSGTRNAAVDAVRVDGTPVVVHVSSALPNGHWVVEIRKPEGNATVPFTTASTGDVYRLPGGAIVTPAAPYRAPEKGPVRLWESTIDLDAWSKGISVSPCFSEPKHATDRKPHPNPLLGKEREPNDRARALDEYLAIHGRPIRYKYVERDWPSEYYQTVYADEMGSAEMPSAGRGFTEDVLGRLRARGVEIAPLILHTGVASLETHEPPYDEYYRVPESTAKAVNAAHRRGGRVIAVGTTVVRALETVTDDLPPTPSLKGRGYGLTHSGEGWTDLVITPERGVRAVDGLITGLHEPEATHLLMLLSMASPKHLRRAYVEAVEKRYLWHEFGDLHLLLR